MVESCIGGTWELQPVCSVGDVKRVEIAHSFHCFFTRRVWKELLKCCLVRNPIIVWDEIVNWGIKTAEAEASVLP